MWAEYCGGENKEGLASPSAFHWTAIRDGALNGCDRVTYLAASKDGPFCSLVLERLNEDLLTGGAARDRREKVLV